MGTEVERKFLVNTMACLDDAINVNYLRQGYLNLDIDKTVRIRMYNTTGAWLTIKGRNQGHTRKEYEYRIPEQDGEELLLMCDGYIVKSRYRIPIEGNLVVEVDVFSGDNLGLVVAEIEFDEDDPRKDLSSSVENFLPDWIGEEITNDDRYYNSALLSNPYKNWK